MNSNASEQNNVLTCQRSYAARLLIDALVENGLNPECNNLSGFTGTQSINEEVNTVSSEQLDNIFDAVTLLRERQTGRSDGLGRFEEKAIDWDISEPWIDRFVQDIASSFPASFDAHQKQGFKVIITHDVDRTTSFEPFSIINSFTTAIGIRRSPWWSIQTAFSPRSIISIGERLLEYEIKKGIGSYFFMMSGTFGFGRHSTRTDIRWKLSRELARLIQQSGMHIGLHGSYSAREKNTYKYEKDRLEQVIGCSVTTHRNHYLRFEPDRIYTQLEEAGIAYDFSVGFVTKIGFRAGSARVYRGFDHSRGCESTVRSVPLLFMDTMFADHDADLLLRELRKLLLEVKKSDGCVSLLFHPEEFLIHQSAWTLFTRVVDLCQELGADLSGHLPAGAEA